LGSKDLFGIDGSFKIYEIYGVVMEFSFMTMSFFKTICGIFWDFFGTLDKLDEIFTSDLPLGYFPVTIKVPMLNTVGVFRVAFS